MKYPGVRDIPISVCRYGVRTRIMFLNKMDRPGASYKSSLLSLLANRFHPNPVPLTLPIASFQPTAYQLGEPGVQGLVDLVNWQVWKWDSDDQPTMYPLPENPEYLSRLDFLPAKHPIIEHLVPARTALLENVAMFSEELMDSLLKLPSGPSTYFERDQLHRFLRKVSLENSILPVVCGSALKHVGTNVLLDYIGELLASPLDVLEGPLPNNPPLQVLVWKVSWDKKRGWMTFVRVYSGNASQQILNKTHPSTGKLKKNSAVFNSTRNTLERASKLLLLYASRAEEVDELPFGSVGVILGFRHTRTGDTITNEHKIGGATKHQKRKDKGSNAQAKATQTLKSIAIPPAVVSTAILPLSHSDEEPVQQALESLSRTDPSVRVDAQDGQLLIHGMGSLHLEIVERRLREEWEAQFEVGKRRVSYREAMRGDITYLHNSVNVAGTPVSVSYRLRPLTSEELGDPLWDGNLVVDDKDQPINPPTSSPQEVQEFIAVGIASALSASPHSSLPMSHVHIQVLDYDEPETLSYLTGASAMLLRNAIREAGPGPVMEPFTLFEISVPEDSFGKVIKDLTEHEGEILETESDGSGQDVDDGQPYSEEGVYLPPLELTPAALGTNKTSNSISAQPRRAIRALAPLSKMLDYSSRMRAISGGHGQFEMIRSDFQEVSDSRRLEILKEIGRV
jgi:elongation factor G